MSGTGSRLCMGMVSFALLAAAQVHAAMSADAPAKLPAEFQFPAACTPGVDCFIQMMPDMDPGPGAVDPYCGSTTRDGYPGTDIRLPSMRDVQRGVDVFAITGGVVIEARDGMADHLVRSSADLAVVAGRECGNGVAIDHGGGLISHYCHLRRSSLAVSVDDRVEAGQKIGQAGVSGLTRYPGVHVTVMQDGHAVDLISGAMAGDGCMDTAPDRSPRFFAGTVGQARFSGTQLLDSGLSGAEVRPGDLAMTGMPDPATAASPMLVAWGRFINLRRGDRVRLMLYGPAGGIVAAKTTLPAAAPQPELALYAGRRGSPAPGRYRVVVELLRDGKTVETSEKSVDIAG